MKKKFRGFAGDLHILARDLGVKIFWGICGRFKNRGDLWGSACLNITGFVGDL